MTSRREAADEVARIAESRLTDNPAEYVHMSQYYHMVGDHVSTARLIEKALALDPDLGMTAYFNLLTSYYHTGDNEMLRKTAERSLPRFSKYLRTHPDDQTQRVHYVWALEFSGKTEEALAEASVALASGMKEGRNLYNLGCVYARLKKYDEALDVLERAVNSGFSFSELKHAREFDALQDTHRFQAILEKLEVSIGNAN
jgi:tetratricopeptide (TPR) repeat protein